MKIAQHIIRDLESIRSQIAGFSFNLLWRAVAVCVFMSALLLVVVNSGEGQTLYGVGVLIAVAKVAGIAFAIVLLLHAVVAFTRWCILAVRYTDLGILAWLHRWVSFAYASWRPRNIAVYRGIIAAVDGLPLLLSPGWTAATAAGRSGAVPLRE